MVNIENIINNAWNWIKTSNVSFIGIIVLSLIFIGFMITTGIYYAYNGNIYGRGIITFLISILMIPIIGISIQTQNTHLFKNYIDSSYRIPIFICLIGFIASLCFCLFIFLINWTITNDFLDLGNLIYFLILPVIAILITMFFFTFNLSKTISNSLKDDEKSDEKSDEKPDKTDTKDFSIIWGYFIGFCFLIPGTILTLTLIALYRAINGNLSVLIFLYPFICGAVIMVLNYLFFEKNKYTDYPAFLGITGSSTLLFVILLFILSIWNRTSNHPKIFIPIIILLTLLMYLLAYSIEEHTQLKTYGIITCIIGIIIVFVCLIYAAYINIEKIKTIIGGFNMNSFLSGLSDLNLFDDFSIPDFLNKDNIYDLITNSIMLAGIICFIIYFI